MAGLKSKGYISMIEQGKCGIGSNQIFAIAKALGVTAGFLFNGSTEPELPIKTVIALGPYRIDSQERDHWRRIYASAALTGYISAYSGENINFPDEDKAADMCFTYADAMLRQEAK